MCDVACLLFHREKKQKIQDIKNNIKEAIEVRKLDIKLKLWQCEVVNLISVDGEISV